MCGTHYVDYFLSWLSSSRLFSQEATSSWRNFLIMVIRKDTAQIKYNFMLKSIQNPYWSKKQTIETINMRMASTYFCLTFTLKKATVLITKILASLLRYLGSTSPSFPCHYDLDIQLPLVLYVEAFLGLVYNKNNLKIILRLYRFKW